MKLNIEVKQKHIDDGIPCNGGECAVALAVNEALSGGKEFPDWTAWVDHVHITLRRKRDGRTLSRTTPSIVFEFLHAYDSGGTIGHKPFAFTIDLPEGFQP